MLCRKHGFNNCPSNLNFLIPIYLLPDGVSLWYFKFYRLFKPTEFIIWNIKGQRSSKFDCKEWLESQSLWQKFALYILEEGGV